MKKTLTESQLNGLISKSVKNVLNEIAYTREEFNATQEIYNTLCKLQDMAECKAHDVTLMRMIDDFRHKVDAYRFSQHRNF